MEAQAQKITHSVMADTIPDEERPGGLWTAVCTCGWTKEGRYARTNEIAEAVALRLANAYGSGHEKEMSCEESS